MLRRNNGAPAPGKGQTMKLYIIRLLDRLTDRQLRLVLAFVRGLLKI